MSKPSCPGTKAGQRAPGAQKANKRIRNCLHSLLHPLHNKSQNNTKKYMFGMICPAQYLKNENTRFARTSLQRLSTFRSISTEWNNSLKTMYCVIVLSSIQDVSPHPMCVETYNIMVSRHTHYTRLDVSSVTASNIRSARLILRRFIVVDSRGDKTMTSHGDSELVAQC